MDKKKKETVSVISQEQLASGIYSLWIETDAACQAVPGQFVSLYSRDGSRLLPRPISICEIAGRSLRLVYRVAGKGTEEFSGLQKGNQIDMLGPLGNGFPLKNKKAFLIGGGIGIPPMLELAKSIGGKKQIIAGYQDETFLTEELSSHGELYVATETGAAGVKGNVMDVIRQHNLSADIIYACGPLPMLKAVKAYAAEQQVECWVSMEERMACGIGACLACVCRSRQTDPHTNVNNKRICKDGPVFLAAEVEL